MTYSKTGPRPREFASKSSHHHVINDPAVAAALKGLYVPPKAADQDFKSLLVEFKPEATPVEHVVAIDGGYSEVPIREGYPSAAIHFFQFGALHFRIEDLEAISKTMHIAPEDMQRLKNIDRLKFPLASRGARRADCSSLNESVRKSLYEFLKVEQLGEDNCLLDTLAWFVFRRYKSTRTDQDKRWTIATNPNAEGQFELLEDSMTGDFTFTCDITGRPIFLSDLFRLHELIEEETGAAGTAGYVAGLVEHLILLHVIRNLLRKNPAALKQVLFILDRPTGWFGVTARTHVLMLELITWLHEHHNLYLAGLEKSGAFVEHAMEIQHAMPRGSILVLNDKYIYRHISPGEEDPKRPYADTSYYGHKVIFRSRSGQMYVVSIPVKELKKSPGAEDLPNLQSILTHIEQLHCDMYENSLLPVALANKLVSLSAHPSSQILKAFAKASVSA